MGKHLRSRRDLPSLIDVVAPACGWSNESIRPNPNCLQACAHVARNRAAQRQAALICPSHTTIASSLTGTVRHRIQMAVPSPERQSDPTLQPLPTVLMNHRITASIRDFLCLRRDTNVVIANRRCDRLTMMTLVNRLNPVDSLAIRTTSILRKSRLRTII